MASTLQIPSDCLTTVVSINVIQHSIKYTKFNMPTLNVQYLVSQRYNMTLNILILREYHHTTMLLEFTVQILRTYYYYTTALLKFTRF